MKTQIKIDGLKLLYGQYDTVEHQVAAVVKADTTGRAVSTTAEERYHKALSKGAETYMIVIATADALLCGRRLLDGVKFCHTFGYALRFEGPGFQHVLHQLRRLLEVEEHMYGPTAAWTVNNLFFPNGEFVHNTAK